VILLLALLLPTRALADQVDIMPSAGWVWGGTQKFDLGTARGDVHVNAAPGYGGTVSMYGRLYGVEAAYHTQGSRAVVRVDGLGEIGGVDVRFHYVVLQILRQYPLPGVTPFLVLGLGGGGLHALGKSDWDVVCTAGGGIRRPFGNGGSVRLTVRMLAPLEIARNGVSLGAANRGVVIGGRNSFFQGDVTLGYSTPLWRPR